CIASGCASYDAMPFVDQRSASTLVDHREIDGLHVAVRELSRDRLSEKHFGRELVADGFLPVVVLLEIDAQTNGAYTLRNEDVHLVLPNGERLSPADPSVVASQVSFSHWRSFFAYLFLLPGPFVTSSVTSANQALEEDYLKKSLRSVRLSRNLPAYSGVIFFALEDVDGDDLPTLLRDAFVELTVYREGDRERPDDLGRRLDFAVHFSE